LLKSSEAVAKLLVDLLKQEIYKSLRTKIGGALAKPAFEALKKIMDPAEVGAAPLLGIDGLVFVGHGRSNAHALVSAIKVARASVEADLLESIRTAIMENLQKINLMEIPNN
jgi:phosphate acyltransferase